MLQDLIQTPWNTGRTFQWADLQWIRQNYNSEVFTLSPVRDMLFIHSIPNVHLYIIPVLQAENSLWSEKGFSITLNTTDKNLGRAAGRKSSSVQPHVLAIQNYILHQINKHCIKYYFFLNYFRFHFFPQETFLFNLCQ